MVTSPPRSGLAGNKARITGRLLLSDQRGLSLHLLGSLTGSFCRLALPRSKRLSLALSLGSKTSHLPLVDPNLTRLDDSSARSLPGEDNGVIG
ncbi:hypothetical protein J2X36_004293 [Methylobacterium sp. BE186]|nr:hypothetical protein [Methylobacterium sp. BE186]